MRQVTLQTLLVATALAANITSGAEYYIAPGGSNANGGTLGSPWGTFDFAIDQLNAGDTLFVRGGTYSLNTRITLASNDGGSAGNPVKIWAYPGEAPILDFNSMTVAWGGSSGRGIQIDDGADWVHIKGLTIQNTRDNGIWSGANNGIFEQITTRWNGDSGMQLSGFASNNLILNADSYENYDPSANGENADGFAIKFADLGPGNIVRGSRAWANSDDGWDMWESTVGGVLVEDCWSFDNGVLLPQFIAKDALELGDVNQSNFGGDATGYKLGQDGGRHVLNRVLAWGNNNGIDVNGNGNGVAVSNSTSFDNNRNWYFDETIAQTTNQHVLKNNISFDGNSGDVFLSGVTHSFNTWNGIPVNAADFLSLDDTIARGPRNADGSLPISDFLRLVPDSNLIDAGVDVGLPYNGTAPDLGAFETTPFVEYASGDFDEDGDVDNDDLTNWQNGFGMLSSATHSDGDADEDGDVDGRDFLVWQRGYAPAMLSTSSALSVPEPQSALLLFLMTAGCGVARRAIR